MAGEPLSAQQVESLGERLLSTRDSLQQQLADEGEQTQPVALDQQSIGRVSRVDAIQQQQVAVAGRQQLTLTLRQVMTALARIESGDYGYCTRCDEPSGFQRLNAQPQAPLCLRCQSASEQ